MSVDWVVVVHRGLNLASKDPNGLSDPYVKVEVRDESGAVLLRKETKVQKKTLNPAWNERFVVRASLDARVHLEVWDWDRVGGHDFMGQTSFALREVRDVAGERQLALETRGNAKEEVKGAVLVSASASGAEQHVRSSLAALGRSTAAEHALSVLSTDNMGMLGVHRAAFAGDVATVGRLLTEAPSLHKAVCRMSGWTALDYASHGNHVEVAKVLLAAKDGMAVSTSRALHLAHSEDMVALLLANGFSAAATLPPLFQTPLLALSRRVAAKAGAAKLLMEAAPAAVTATDACGRSALFFVVRAGNVELLALLMQQAKSWTWSPTMDKTLAELNALKPSIGAEVTVLLRKASLIK